ncbi:unnamed protein product [Vicia faba]|uniref:Uncharacterized protein n=1 Tax=Vicia faba TaxID=3906 RepID=A0AAV1A6M7_VICFA|nr:unnamed protein product [Vicia faba]
MSTEKGVTKLRKSWRRTSWSTWMLIMRAKGCCSLSRRQGKWEEKMVYVKSKAREIFGEKEYLQKSLDDALLREKDFEKEVSDLTDEVVSASSVYFEVDEEAVAYLELRNLASIEISQGDVDVKESGEFGDP